MQEGQEPLSWSVLDQFENVEGGGVPLECRNLDQLEEVGQAVQTFLVNIDLSDSQFKVDTLVEQAEKLGMDFGDLQEFGLEVNSSSCPGSTCFNKQSFKNYDQILNHGARFGVKLGEQGAKLYKRASECHESGNLPPKV